MFLCAALLAWTAGGASVTVDFTSPTGPVKPLHGVNGSPVRHETKNGAIRQAQGELRDAGVPYCRLHDVAGRYGLHHYVDIPNVFPDFDADENDPKSYDFAFTDAYLKTLVKSGVRPYYRLGATIESSCDVKPYNILPPKDPAKWARICEHVVAHYNEGWADGYRWNIEHWEIWNEPETGWSMWYRGTKEQFFTLYETASRHLKRRFPGIKVGGYGSIGFYAVDQPDHPVFGSGAGARCNTAQYAEDFLRRMRERGAPIDFFSWHLYLKPPYPLERIATHARHCRELLDRYGFTATESHFNEWNVVGDVNMDKGPKDWDAVKEAPVASQVAAAFVILQSAPVDKAMYYRALPTSPYCGLFYWPSAAVTPVYDAFVAFNALYRRKTAVKSVSDVPKVYALGASDEASGEAVLLANIAREPKEVELKVSGAKGRFFRVRRIDGEHKRLADVGLFVTGRRILLPPTSVTLLERPAEPPSAEDAFVETLLADMTLEEKVGQLVQRGALKGWVDPVAADATANPLDGTLVADIRAGRVGALLGACGIDNYNACQEAARASRLKIPLLVGADLIHGCRTSYPIPLGLSCAWDEDLWRRAGELLSNEAPLVGCNWTFAPMVDIARDARWGRIAEGAGQDPFLAARFAAATVRGIQCDVPSGRPRLAATLKHFVAYGAAEGGRDYAAAEVTDSVLRDIYLPPFKAGIDAGAFAVMPSFQTIDGVPLSVNRRLLTDVLRGELGFGGLCVSDMGAIGECGPDGHAVAGTLSELSALAVRAGMNIEMERRDNRVFASALAAACREGKVLETEIDARVREVLRVKRRLGLFDGPLIDAAKVRADADPAKNRAFAREAATRAAVLLRNEGDVLPLARGRRVALVGAAGATKGLLFGTWTTWTDNADRLTVEEGLRAHGVDVTCTPAYGQRGDETQIDVAALEKACAAADVVVATFGIRRAGGEAQSRSDLSLAACERRASEVIAASGKPFVAVLFTGIPVAIPELAERADAILEMWGAGSCAGIATADLLTGAASPSGRLTCDFPKSTGQCPLYYNHLPTGRPYDPEKRFSSRYVEGPNGALYPFGFGLTYTTFAYSPTTVTAGKDGTTLACTVTNTGKRSGRAVVQAYVRRCLAGRSTPVRELRGFEAVTLEPGESRVVTVNLAPEPGDSAAVLAPDSATGDLVRLIGPDGCGTLHKTFR